MKISQKGIDLIKQFESFGEKQYRCSAGKLTIGYGHVVLASDKFPPLITKLEAEEILRKDLEGFEKSLNQLIKVSLTQNQFDALMSLIFNIGATNFGKSTLLKFLNSRFFNKIPNEIRRWCKIKGVVSNALKNRREDEIKVWLA